MTKKQITRRHVFLVDLLSTLQFEIERRNLYLASDLEITITADENANYVAVMSYTPVED